MSPCAHAARRLAALALLLPISCGGDEPEPPAATPASPEAPLAGATGPDAEQGFAGTWYVFMPDLPWLGLRLAVRPAAEGQHVTWISFDWSTSEEAESLASRSKPVEVILAGDTQSLLLDGPSPMLAENGQPNGQRGRWHLELHPALDGPARMVGTATHSELTAPEGLSAEMTRDFRAWKRP